MPTDSYADTSPKNGINTTAREIDPVDRYSVLILRGTIIGTGLLGLALVVRNARMFATYQHVKQIPAEYYQLGIPMKGVVREVTPSGWLRVEHHPDVKLPKMFGFRKRSKIPGNLNLRLAGLEVSPVGIEYLTSDLRLVGRPVAFNVIKPVDGQPDACDADVTAKKTMRNANLNVELVRKGYARVFGLDNPAHKTALQSNTNYSRLITRLLTVEQVAKHRGLGIWERSTWVERLCSYPSTIVQIVQQSTITKFMILCFYMLRNMFAAIFSIAKNLYYILVALGGYTAEGYRRFARLIDRVNSWYFGLKGTTRSGQHKVIQPK